MYKRHKRSINHMTIIRVLIIIFVLINPYSAHTLEYPEIEFKIFQFPSDMIPRIDGKTDDWDIVPEEYFYGNELLQDVSMEVEDKDIVNSVNPGDKDVKVCVGWVNGINKLYVLYESYDNNWVFEKISFENDMIEFIDMFEFIVDGNTSGGEFIYKKFIPEEWLTAPTQNGSHAQNYHIFTPASNRNWAMVWNCPTWVNKLPFMNCAYSYDFDHGDSGKLVLEFWITPFDYISFKGIEFSAVTLLEENEVIGVSWLIVDWDNDGSRKLLCLSHDVMVVHDASYLRPFRLMPIEDKFIKPIDAYFTFEILYNNTKTVAFKDLSRG